jgi:hypothetical protein
MASINKPLAERSNPYPKKAGIRKGAQGDNINARILKENRLRKAKTEKQSIGRQVRTVHAALALKPEWSDESLDRLVVTAAESYRHNAKPDEQAT